MRPIDLYLQEYGTGRFNKKHSTFYAAMMRELGLSDRNEDYLHLVPWQSLAAMNHNFLLTERRRHYLRYLGGLTFFEVHRWVTTCLVLHQAAPCNTVSYLAMNLLSPSDTGSSSQMVGCAHDPRVAHDHR